MSGGRNNLRRDKYEEKKTAENKSGIHGRFFIKNLILKSRVIIYKPCTTTFLQVQCYFPVFLPRKGEKLTFLLLLLLDRECRGSRSAHVRQQLTLTTNSSTFLATFQGFLPN
ncbi:hypothetical protein SLEP1_g50610 [Rubroshorea leprosula]|uniref:Uncharacterized protein n=1 Tax=Rubroshorea leprosula TaxID=152421 RepID=A0AAV5M420_9ROSI|nr:hypothetical protein SLEP1_g50610 [Rubroshorea leprosula]